MRDIAVLKRELKAAEPTLFPELKPFYAWCLAQLEDLEDEGERILWVLARPKVDLDAEMLEILLSKTEDVQRELRTVSNLYIPCILHSKSIDRLLLSVINWLHRSHEATRRVSFALASESFAIIPHSSVKRLSPSIYLAPSSARLGLMFVPLLFHEFGHTLYEQHKLELADLIEDVQTHIGQALAPRVSVRDSWHESQLEERRNIVEGWFPWMQEFFCDAVGISIGGPAFAKAYSSLMLTSGKHEFTVPPEKLARRKHPVSWLRARFFCHRLMNLGFEEDARATLKNWEMTARAFGVNEEYYGYYDASFFPVINQALDDMLEEASPLPFNPEAVRCGTWDNTSPVPLLNDAWRRWDRAENGYLDWEQGAVSAFLAAETR